MFSAAIVSERDEQTNFPTGIILVLANQTTVQIKLVDLIKTWSQSCCRVCVVPLPSPPLQAVPELETSWNGSLDDDDDKINSSGNCDIQK